MNKTDLLFQMMEQPQAYTDQQWQEILCEDCPWVPLYVGELFCLATADLQGVQMNTEQIFKLHELHY